MNKTFKKLLSIILAFVLLFGSVPMANFGLENLFAVKVSAEDEDEENLENIIIRSKDELKTYGDYVYYVENNEVTIYYYIGEETNIIIPSEIEGLPVKKLEAQSFSTYGSMWDTDDDDITNKALEYVESVSLPDSIEIIGNNAFQDCDKLAEIRLSENLREIGWGAFGCCAQLANLIFTGNKLEKVGGNFIEFSPLITEITIPGSGGVELTICENAFRYSKVKRITVQSDFVRLEENCFYPYRIGNYTNVIDEIIIEGKITCCETSPFGRGTTIRPKAFIVKNKPDESVYACCTGVNFMGYIDNYQGKGWTYFASRAEIEWSVEGDYRYFLNGDNAVVTDYTGEETGTLIVPDTLGGKPVTEIGHRSFVNCLAEYIKLPDTVESVGTYAFERCGNMKRLEYNTEKAIPFGANAFQGCSSLETMVFNNNIKKLPDKIFYYCKSLSEVIAPGVTEICSDAFLYCTSLESVHFSAELHTVGDSAFYLCEKLKTIGVSGEKITSLGAGALAKTLIDSFVFSDELTEIPERCFEETLLTSAVIPGNVKAVGDSAFLDCTNLESVVLPDNLKIIGEYAFYNCKLIESVDLPESLTEIGDYAFNMCENLSGEIRLGKNLVYVGDYAFSDTLVTSLYYNAPSAEKGNDIRHIKAFDSVKLKSIIIGNDVKVLPAGVFKDQELIETIVIPDSVEVIGMDVFKNCTSLKNLTLPDSVTEIGVRAFAGCNSLTEFTVPKNTKFLGKNAIPKTVTTVYFNAENCELYYPDNLNVSPFADSNIKKVIVGDTVKRIPDYFFSEYDYEANLVIPDSVTEIGKYAFKNSSVKNITLSQNLISIEEGTFSGSHIELSENSLPESLRMIGKSAFENCDYLTELYVPDSVLDIDEYAFYDCDSLVKVRMSPNVKLIPESAFRSCDSLTTFEWDSDVKLIGEYAFTDDTLLADFDFKGVEKIYPNSFTGSGVSLVMLGENKKEEATDLEVVEVSSFENCANLETLSIGGNVATIKSAAFANCEKLETAVISPTVTNIASDAFDGCDALTIYCVEDSYVHEYAVDNGIPVSTFVIDAIPNQVYTGKEIEPDVNVKVSDKKLTENTDFAVKYSDNINVGTAKVFVSGKGIYKVLASMANFTIITKDLENIIVSPVVNQVYTGSEIRPELTVTNGSETLTEGIDYTVVYKNNTEAGTATAEITGIGNYSGKTIVTFEIEEQTFWQKIISFFEMIFDAIINFLNSIFK